MPPCAVCGVFKSTLMGNLEDPRMVCPSCQAKTDTHKKMYPECDVAWHDGYDSHPFTPKE